MLVAVVDDDDAHNEHIAQILRREGHGCVAFTRPTAFLREAQRQTFDLLITDWTMPEATGVEIIRQIRSGSAPTLPILMLTSRSSEQEIVEALRAGADDFLVKPITAPVLAARVEALLRRAYAQEARRSWQFGRYGFDAAKETIEIDGEAITLTTKEFRLAWLFFQNLGRPLSRDYLLHVVWNRRGDVETRTLDAHVSRIRVKLGLRPANGYRLVTVYGFGYRLEAIDIEAPTP